MPTVITGASKAKLSVCEKWEFWMHVGFFRHSRQKIEVIHLFKMILVFSSQRQIWLVSSRVGWFSTSALLQRKVFLLFLLLAYNELSFIMVFFFKSNFSFVSLSLLPHSSPSLCPAPRLLSTFMSPVTFLFPPLVPAPLLLHTSLLFLYPPYVCGLPSRRSTQPYVWNKTGTLVVFEIPAMADARPSRKWYA